MIEERRYTKRELARLYWPKTKNIKSAMKNLREDINRCPELVEELKRIRWNVNKHSYSAEQVRLIIKYLCENISFVLFGSFRNSFYLCSMKKEFGKWLMDVAKYMVTALLLSTIFADLNEPIIIYIVVILSIVVLLIGLLLVSDVHLYEDKSITNKKKGQKK